MSKKEICHFDSLPPQRKSYYLFCLLIFWEMTGICFTGLVVSTEDCLFILLSQYGLPMTAISVITALLNVAVALLVTFVSYLFFSAKDKRRQKEKIVAKSDEKEEKSE